MIYNIHINIFFNKEQPAALATNKPSKNNIYFKSSWVLQQLDILLFFLVLNKGPPNFVFLFRLRQRTSIRTWHHNNIDLLFWITFYTIARTIFNITKGFKCYFLKYIFLSYYWKNTKINIFHLKINAL